ncbi:hypothetical protein HYPSUDRAFT_47894 [Hypholoma sublateritium FD-334 SS-4]|uniref:Lipoyl-binding domain-containing protein n=1 Tax=Hypholoma sublateritium (strain FD-334 SS-4) TaxID=945553 RepID=A0A0D2KMV3_HYPSF|nr:hypothetical protein HYPSUDRAFT_47894 [Hypholoma sublateritium FD-334 SS-4]
MSAFTVSKVSAAQSAGARYGQAKRRWLHGSLKRQASIIMPALSPLMTEGTITRWKKKEGDAFAAGDVLLQIQSDLYTVDVEACNSGILGKIIMPAGTSNVPIEQIIALVARDANELAIIQGQSTTPIPPKFNALPAPPSSPISTPLYRDQFRPLSSPRTPTTSPRTPSLFEMQTMGYGHRSAHVGGPRRGKPRLNLVNAEPISPIEMSPRPSPMQSRPRQEDSLPMTPSTAKWPQSARETADEGQAQVNGAALRRMIVSNLASKQGNPNFPLDEFL